jgi:hypothetical protein
MSKVYLGRFNQYKVGNKIVNGLKQAEFYQRGYKLIGGRNYEIEKLDIVVDEYHDDGVFYTELVE